MRLASLLPLFIFAHTLFAENWPFWRELHDDDISLEENGPAEWNPNKNIAWKTLIPGKGRNYQGRPSPFLHWEITSGVKIAVNNVGIRRNLGFLS